MHALISKLVGQNRPELIRFILIDTKGLDFRPYTDIPHLIVPVCFDIKKAMGPLQWAQFEMNKRYALFSEANVRDLKSYNQIAHQLDEGGRLPQMVVVIDEIGELLSTMKKDFLEYVSPLLLKGSQVGIHLIFSSCSGKNAKVVENIFPTTISIKKSKDRYIATVMEADKDKDSEELQVPHILTKDIISMCDFIRNGGRSCCSDEVIREIEEAATGKAVGSVEEQSKTIVIDALFQQATELVFETQQVSVSLFQRRLKLGYSRAAELVDNMEQLGIVGPSQGAKPRAILVTKEQWLKCLLKYATKNVNDDNIKSDHISSMHSSDNAKEQKAESGIWRFFKKKNST